MPRNCYTCFQRTGEYACALNIKDYPCVNFSRWESLAKAFTSSLTKDMTLKEACEIARKDRERIEESMKEEVLKKEEEEMGRKLLCGINCKYRHGSVYKPECVGCELWPYRNYRNNWEADTPELPEKHEGLTWQEADKLWHEGWFLTRKANTAIEIGDWDSVDDWRTVDVRATDWFVAGRRKT